ncbi:LysR family transcriptional regulator [Bradyrhizobium sp.]|uniref:LysR family transcriptional regulator n=1 Tax=Bradyrhizobium sp. TaxID=376 RepID=UPI003C68B26A
MDLKQLNYFLCLAREGNMTRAARQLNIVQPALSMQIAKLEKDLGKQLFDRAAHGVSLTSAGETLVRLAETITKEVDRAREEMAHVDGVISGRVSIGMITSAAQSTLAASSAKIAARYPGIRLLICEGYTDTLIAWVVSGELDVAIINIPRRKIPLTAHHILDEEMMLAGGAGNNSHLSRTVSFKQVESMDVVIPSRRHGLRMILDDAAATAGFILKPRLEIDTLPAICEIVASTEMVTILPGIALNAFLAERRIRAQMIRRPAISRAVGWVTNPRRIISGAAAAVMEIISADLNAAANAAARLVEG